jgi:hypothetical protein
MWNAPELGWPLQAGSKGAEPRHASNMAWMPSSDVRVRLHAIESTASRGAGREQVVALDGRFTECGFGLPVGSECLLEKRLNMECAQTLSVSAQVGVGPTVTLVANSIRPLASGLRSEKPRFWHAA